MKLHLSLLFTFLLFSCNDANDIEYIELHEVRDFFPQSYKSNSIIVFVNSDEEELELQSEFIEKIVHQNVLNKNVEMDEFTVQLYSNVVPLNITLLGSAFLSIDLQDITPSVLASLMPLNNPSGVYMDIRITSNYSTSIYNTEFLQRLVLINKEFEDVFSVITSDFQQYNQLYLSKELGIVGFSDENENLWVYDRIKS